MASSSKKRQTIAKRDRERAVKEKRALKQEKKEARKQAAAEAAGVIGTVELQEDQRAPGEALELLHDGTGALTPQRDRDLQDEPGPRQAGQIDDDQRHVADDHAVREPDRIAR
jgi:hypothetical protein